MLKSDCKVTPKTFREETLARPGIEGGSRVRLLGFLKMISDDLEGLRRRLLREAQALMLSSSRGTEAELEEGTIR